MPLLLPEPICMLIKKMLKAAVLWQKLIAVIQYEINSDGLHSCSDCPAVGFGYPEVPIQGWGRRDERAWRTVCYRCFTLHDTCQMHYKHKGICEEWDRECIRIEQCIRLSTNLHPWLSDYAFGISDDDDDSSSG